MKYKLYLPTIILLATSGVVNYSLAKNDFTENYYDSMKNGSLSLQTKTCELIADYSGITDKRIFDTIELQLLSLAGHEKLSGNETKAAICFTKALASSGNELYQESLKTVSEKTKSRKLRKAALQALPEIRKFRRWNAVINGNDFELEGRDSSLAMWMRLIDSDQADMGFYALEKSKTFANYDVNFLILLEEKVRAAIPQKNITKDKLDFYYEAMTFLMSHPEFGKYTSLINEVAETSKSKELGKLARKALRL